MPASRGIVCGAHNFAVGDLVVVSLPGAVLPGGFAIAARKTYGHVSDGMICSASELGLGDEHDGIMVLATTAADPAPGDDAAPVLHLREEVLDIAVTPDRGYCLSLRGLAREAAQATGVAFRDPVALDTPAAVADGYPVRSEAEACPLFVAVSVTGVDPTRPSPRWLARRVQLAGMRSISLTVDITNYVMLETGQPIHAYDADRLDGPIVVRARTAGEKLTTLDDVVRDLSTDDLLITDGSGPIGLAGVMGGASTEIGADTTSVVVEAAHFDAMTVARTSRRHKLSSEASRRFERGVDPAAAYAAAHRVADLLVELAGGPSSRARPWSERFPLRPHHDRGRPAGPHPRHQLDQGTVVSLLEAVGADGRGRRHGADDHPAELATRPDRPVRLRRRGRSAGRLRHHRPHRAAGAGRPRLDGRPARSSGGDRRGVAAGFVEVLSFPFTAAEELDKLGVPADDRRRRLNRIANPLAETAPYLRTTLLPGLFAAVARNRSRGNDDLALVETGSVFFAAEPAGPRRARR